MQYHRSEFLSSDPLEFVHRYEDPWDQEAVALIAALLAYGNVKQIRASVEDALKRTHAALGPPSQFVQGPLALKRKALKGFVHRFNVGEDLALLLDLLRESWVQYGSLGAHFVSNLEPGDENIGKALDTLISDWRKWVRKHGEVSPSFSYLLTSPKDGSCCKRWCMFLRWMGREEDKEKLDPGLWTRTGSLTKTFPKGRWLRPEQLIIPLDTHTGRISQYLGLTSRKTMNWRSALEVTESLKACYSEDPTRYDFSLSRLGILDLCQRKYRKEICEKCELVSVCRFAQARLTS